ncbi:Protein T08G2.2 [Aphelenchoides avenae]|nr:Protein T08G2.2 [Aphelenchus avenae]
MYRKHCAASIYLAETDWMLVLDADTGVVNPNHCIEEYVDDRVDIVLYERFFNWEIMSGNYLVRNTPFARNFLRTWADLEYTQPYNWSGRDNGALQIHVLRTVLPDAKAEINACENIWHRAVDYETYMAYVVCVKMALGAPLLRRSYVVSSKLAGATRLFPGKLRILRRAHGFARDGAESWDSWCEKDFMFHGWKAQDVGTEEWESPFERRFDLSECGTGYAGWNWRPQKRVSVAKIKEMLAENEKFNAKEFPSIARVHPFLDGPDTRECYPNCDDET